jgi:hypothetical protein
MKLPNHLFVSSTDGHLYDTRVEGWAKLPPLRRDYYGCRGRVDTAAKVKAALRAGGFAWPGGYPMYFVLDDGEALSFKGARENLREILYDMTHDVTGSGSWNVVGTDINYEDDELVCVQTGEKIEAAYA